MDSELKMYTSRIRNHRQSVDNLLTYSKGIARIVSEKSPRSPPKKIKSCYFFFSCFHLGDIWFTDLAPMVLSLCMQLAHILEYRNDELLIKNSEELHRSSESAREIATAAKAEQGAVALILAKAQKDSSLVKILTFVAMLYLPASLIAVRKAPFFFGWWYCYYRFGMVKKSPWKKPFIWPTPIYQTLFSSNLIQLPSPQKSLMIGKLNVSLSKAFWLYPVLTLGLTVLTLILVVASARWLGSRKVATKNASEAERALELGTVKAW